MAVENIAELFATVKTEITRAVLGQDETVELALAALLSGGHVLLEGVPGLAKTMLVKSIAASLNMHCRRVQMTPDLLPGDITGASIYREDLKSFEFRQGPVFTNFLLADELNRASARTQSALLEAMQELTVTHDGDVHHLPDPFVVFATQNPVDQEGTYPLPIAQLDRFMFKITMTYPKPADEERMLREHHGTGGTPQPAALGVRPVLSADDIISARALIRGTFVRDEVISYVRRLVQATREDDALTVGASPRAGLSLLMAAKTMARFAGREHATPDDIKRAFKPSLRHRVVASPSAELEGTDTDAVLGNILDNVEVPR